MTGSIVHRCSRDKSVLPGVRSGLRYEKVCVGTHISTLQELVTYRGLDGLDAGRYFHTTLSHWQRTFHEEGCDCVECELLKQETP